MNQYLFVLLCRLFYLSAPFSIIAFLYSLGLMDPFFMDIYRVWKNKKSEEVSCSRTINNRLSINAFIWGKLLNGTGYFREATITI